MDSILAQDEVNALLNAMKAGGLDDEDGDSTDAVSYVPYDLTSNQRVIRGNLPALEILAERQARRHRNSLSGFAKRVVEVSYRATEFVRFGDLQSALTSPVCLSLVRLAPLSGTCALIYDMNFLFAVLDAVFGGRGNFDVATDRELTTVENRFVERIARVLLTDIEHAWASVEQIRGDFQRVESNPRLLNIAVAGDVMARIEFDVDLEGKSHTTLALVMPYNALQPLHGKLASAFQSEHDENDESWKSKIVGHLLTVPVETVAVLGTKQMGLSEISNLKAGDILQLDADARAPIDLRLGGRAVTRGTPDVVGGSVSLRLTDELSGPPKPTSSVRVDP